MKLCYPSIKKMQVDKVTLVTLRNRKLFSSSSIPPLMFIALKREKKPNKKQKSEKSKNQNNIKQKTENRKRKGKCTEGWVLLDEEIIFGEPLHVQNEISRQSCYPILYSRKTRPHHLRHTLTIKLLHHVVKRDLTPSQPIPSHPIPTTTCHSLHTPHGTKNFSPPELQ